MLVNKSLNKRTTVTLSRRQTRSNFVTSGFPYMQLFFILSFLISVHGQTLAPNPVKSNLTKESSQSNQGKGPQTVGSQFLDESKIKKVPVLRNRFDTPWYVPERTKFLSLTESRHRVLYSPLRSRSGDGLGHSFSVMNAEIGAALRFGLTYTHRISSYGSLTVGEPSAVEHFFGWGHEQIPRSFIRESFCKSSFDGFPSSCEVCKSLVKNSSISFMHFNELVNLPRKLTYSRRACSRIGDAHQKEECFQQQVAFLKAHNKSHTIFQMPIDTCGSNPTDAYVDQETRSYLFHQYWSRHGKRKSEGNNLRLKEQHQRTVYRGGIPQLQFTGRERVIKQREEALNIAIHARRGDFFNVKREMVSTRAFGNVVRSMMEVVQRRGGVFAEMAVIVHIYSEGTLVKGSEKAIHDVTKMNKWYRDSDGTVRNESWVTRVIRASGKSESTSSKKYASGNDTRRLALFPRGLQVKFHIASDTLTSLHEMISADIFIGSLSGMGLHVVTTLSRGIHLMPRRVSAFNMACCSLGFDSESGRIEDSTERVEAFWDGFVRANEASASRALATSKKT